MLIFQECQPKHSKFKITRHLPFNYCFRLVPSILGILLISLTLLFSCKQVHSPASIDLKENWKFSPDENNLGISEKWYSIEYDDSQWALINAGKRWEDQGFADLDSYGWYRKEVEIPRSWKGKKIWLKFGGVNDAYEVFINGESVGFFGEANISYASKPSFTEISKYLEFGESNKIALQIN